MGLFFTYNSQMATVRTELDNSPTGPDILWSPDRPLVGKTAIVTGGNRDVGRGIVEALARAGVISAWSYLEKGKRAKIVLDNVAVIGGQTYSMPTDFRTSEGRESFYGFALEQLGNDIDFLILNSSGRTEELNGITSNHLLDMVLPHMRRGGVVIGMQSVPGHLMHQLDGSFSLGEYDKVARAKKPALDSLHDRIPEMEAHGVRFIEVCPSIVSGTKNVDFANWRDTTAETQHNLVTDRLGLPKAVTAKDVGEKVVELLKNPDIRSGHTEFFNGVLDTLTPLESIYGVSAIYVNTLKMEDDIDEQRHGIARAIISLEQATRSNDPNMIDGLRLDLINRVVGEVTITPEHAKGHFGKDSGFPLILPGHKQIGTAVDTIGAIKKALGKADLGVRIIGFESAVFSSVVFANGNTDLLIIPTQISDDTYNVEILRESNGERTAFIKGLKVRPATQSDNNTLLEHQVIEGAAQATGFVGIKDLDGGNMPLLRSIGRVEFVPGNIKAGEGIKYDVLARQVDKRTIHGSVLVYSEGQIIGVVGRIRAALVKKDTALRLLKTQ